MEEGSMNFRKMLECMAAYAKSDRAPELREAVQLLVDDEVARRKRTAARLWEMRRHSIWYAEHMKDHDDECNYRALDIELRRQAVDAAVNGNAVRAVEK
jgi:hypothetical protein